MWVFFDLLLQSTIVWFIAELLCRLAGREAAALRYRIRFASLTLVFLLPLLALCMPQWSIVQLPAADAVGRIAVTSRPIAIRQPLENGGSQAWIAWLWLVGAAVRFLPFIVGYFRIGRLARRAVLLDEPLWVELLADLSSEYRLPNRIRLLVSQEATVPMVFGLVSKRIVLPASCSQWSAGTKRSVLAHELAHVRRGDITAQLLISFIASAWWFQPLLFFTLKQLRRDSELACDRMAVKAGIAPSAYATDLLAIARSIRNEAGLRRAAIAMASENDLETRVRALVAPLQPKPMRAVAILSFCTLFTATMAASAIAIHPKQNIKSAGGTMMRRLLPSALLATAGVSAATIGGTLYTQRGEAVSNATAVLYNPDTNAKLQSASDGVGKFSFDGLAPGQYILRVEKPGFAALFRELAVAGSTRLDKGLTMMPGVEQQTKDAAVAQGTRTAAAQADQQQAIRIGGNVAAAKLVTQVQPVYPAEAKRNGVQGTVRLEVVLSREGVPQDIRVLDSPSEDLSQSALEAVRQWRYSSTLLNGEPVEVVTEVKVNYSLQP